MILVAAFLFFLPAGMSNMMPVFVSKLPWLKKWNTPIDFGHTFRGKPIFGSHKTWRGLLCGVIGGSLVGWALPHDFIAGYYPTWSVAVAASMSLGALAGDAIKSFFKRRVDIKSGGKWFPFDQLDYIIGGLVCVLPFGAPSISLTTAIVLSYFCLVIISTHIGYWLGLKESPL